jgi:AraC-like DNA-binding protein
MPPLATLARRTLDTPATRELVPHLPGESFRWIEHDYPSPVARWNFHPEYELHLIRKGSGSYLIGDHVGEFAAGHVALVGPDLPHDWMSDVSPDEIIEGRDALIQFDQAWIDRCMAALPELADVADLLAASRRGIVFGGRTARIAAGEIEAVGASTGTHRLGHLFALLSVLAEAPDHDIEYMTVDHFPALDAAHGRAATEAGLQYILENFTGDIRMSEAARLAHMSEPTFSRYFKKASGHTFTEMVRGLRIANACRLLARTDSTIAAISQAVGYGNLANFNRQFRQVVGLTPREYRALPEDERPAIRSVR